MPLTVKGPFKLFKVIDWIEWKVAGCKSTWISHIFSLKYPWWEWIIGRLAGLQLYNEGNCALIFRVLVNSSPVRCALLTFVVVLIWNFSISFNFHIPLHLKILAASCRGSANISREQQFVWNFWLDQKQEEQETLFLKVLFLTLLMSGESR